MIAKAHPLVKLVLTLQYQNNLHAYFFSLNSSSLICFNRRIYSIDFFKDQFLLSKITYRFKVSLNLLKSFDFILLKLCNIFVVKSFVTRYCVTRYCVTRYWVTRYCVTPFSKTRRLCNFILSRP